MASVAVLAGDSCATTAASDASGCGGDVTMPSATCGTFGDLPAERTAAEDDVCGTGTNTNCSFVDDGVGAGAGARAAVALAPPAAPAPAATAAGSAACVGTAAWRHQASGGDGVVGASSGSRLSALQTRIRALASCEAADPSVRATLAALDAAAGRALIALSEPAAFTPRPRSPRAAPSGPPLSARGGRAPSPPLSARATRGTSPPRSARGVPGATPRLKRANAAPSSPTTTASSPRPDDVPDAVDLGVDLEKLLVRAPPRTAAALRGPFARLLRELDTMVRRSGAGDGAFPLEEQSLESPQSARLASQGVTVLRRRLQTLETTYRGNMDKVRVEEEDCVSRVTEASRRVEYCRRQAAGIEAEVQKLRHVRLQLEVTADARFGHGSFDRIDTQRGKWTAECTKQLGILGGQILEREREQVTFEEETRNYEEMRDANAAMRQRLANLRSGKAGRDGCW